MYNQFQTVQQSPKKSSPIPRVTFTHQMNYKQRANILFDKLNTFKTNLQNQKYYKFQQVLKQLKTVQNKLQSTTQQKQQHYDKVMNTLNQIDQQIKQSNIEYNRFKKILDNLIDNTNRQIQSIFDKMTKEAENNQSSINKFIDFKIQAFVLKNKGVWLQQDLLNFQPFKEELNYLKKQIQQYYKSQNKQLQKIKKQLSDSLEKQKQFLIFQMKRTDHQDIMLAIQNLHSDISKKISQLTQKRQNVQKNVLSMIENVIDSYVKDTKKFK